MSPSSFIVYALATSAFLNSSWHEDPHVFPQSLSWPYGPTFERHRLRQDHALAQVAVQNALISLNSWSADALLSECYGRASKYVQEFEGSLPHGFQQPVVKNNLGNTLQRVAWAARESTFTGRKKEGMEESVDFSVKLSSPGGVLPALSFLSSRPTLSLSVGLSEDVLVLATQALAVGKASSLALVNHGRVVTALLQAEPIKVARALFQSTFSSASSSTSEAPSCPEPPRLPSLHSVSKALDAYIDSSVAVLSAQITFSFSLHAVLSRGNLSVYAVCPEEWEERAADLRLAAVLEKERLEKVGGEGGVGQPPLDIKLDALDVSESFPVAPDASSVRSAAGPGDFFALLADLLDATEELLTAPIGEADDGHFQGRRDEVQSIVSLSTLSSACILRQAVSVASRGKGWGGGSKRDTELTPAEISNFCSLWNEAAGDEASLELAYSLLAKGGNAGVCGGASTLSLLGASRWNQLIHTLREEEGSVADNFAV